MYSRSALTTTSVSVSPRSTASCFASSRSSGGMRNVVVFVPRLVTSGCPVSGAVPDQCPTEHGVVSGVHHTVNGLPAQLAAAPGEPSCPVLSDLGGKYGAAELGSVVGTDLAGALDVDGSHRDSLLGGCSYTVQGCSYTAQE